MNLGKNIAYCRSFWFIMLMFFYVGMMVAYAVELTSVTQDDNQVNSQPDKREETKADYPPGILFSLEKMVQMNNDYFILSMKKAAFNSFSSKDLQDASSIAISKAFLKSIFFNTDSKYSSRLLSDQTLCTFAAFLDSNLLKTVIDPIENVMIDLVKTEGQSLTGLVSKSDFLNFLYKGKCFDKGQIAESFSPENYLKTLKKIEFKIPSNQQECQQIYLSFLKNPYLPFLCKYPETMAIGRRLTEFLKTQEGQKRSLNNMEQAYITVTRIYEKNIPLSIQSYLKNLCDNLKDKNTFCRTHLNTNFWKEAMRGEHPFFFLKFRCQDIMKNPILDREILNRCVIKMEQDPYLCTNLSISERPSLYPKPDCNELQAVLPYARLKTPYVDCPGSIDFENAVNFNRIFRHFDFLNNPNKKVLDSANSCLYDMLAPFAQIVLKSEDEYTWPLSICYTSIITNQRECEPYIPGEAQLAPLSEQNVMSSILAKIRGAPSNEKCAIVDKAIYNPLLLEYKSNCFIVVDRNKCSSFSCPKIVYHRGKVIDDIQYEGELDFEYFSTSYINTQYSMEHIFEKKLGLKKTPLPNFTLLQNYFKNNKDGIVHGVGCIENIFPDHFRVYNINQCTPSPFIIDGVVTTETQTFLSLRSALDDVHTPRLVDWNFVFSAISAYQELHPLSLWMLYGISK